MDRTVQKHLWTLLSNNNLQRGLINDEFTVLKALVSLIERELSVEATPIDSCSHEGKLKIVVDKATSDRGNYLAFIQCAECKDYLTDDEIFIHPEMDLRYQQEVSETNQTIEQLLNKIAQLESINRQLQRSLTFEKSVRESMGPQGIKVPADQIQGPGMVVRERPVPAVGKGRPRYSHHIFKQSKKD